MKFKVPKSFDLAGNTFQVFQDQSVHKLAGCWGQTHFDDGIVILAKSLKPDMEAITFNHELVHAILLTMGQTELNKDEAFVDNFASLLWQAHKSAKY
jgi:Zn-dependent peptidase ImmA (M78 family)